MFARDPRPQRAPPPRLQRNVVCRREEAGAHQGDPPSPVATVWNSRQAIAVLEEEVADAASGPVGAEAGSLLHVKNFYSVTHGVDDGCFRGLESGLKFRGPQEVAAGTGEWLEGCHDVAPDVGCGGRGGELPNGI